jgi:integrase
VWVEPGLVFKNEAGEALRAWDVTRSSFQDAMQQAGLPSIRFHDLRHTAATTALSRGVHPKVVQEMLGHAAISVTLDTCTMGAALFG